MQKTPSDIDVLVLSLQREARNLSTLRDHLPTSVNASVAAMRSAAVMLEKLKIAELVSDEYNSLIRHMDSGGDYYEFLKNIPQH